MAKIMFVSPRLDIQERAMRVALQENPPHCQPVLFRVASGREIYTAAEEAVKEQVDVIIARGQQANLIRQSTGLPVVDLLLTGQELGVMVAQVKEHLKKRHPIIAVIGLPNMYSDMQEFDRLFDVELRRYLVDDVDQLEDVVRVAGADGADVILGGDLSCRFAQKYGVPSLFVNSGREGIASALRQAELVAQICDRERKNTAQLRTLLDYSFNGIVQLDENGRVLSMNHVAETLLGLRQKAALGRPINDLIPLLSPQLFEEVLREGKELFSRMIQFKKRACLVNLAPIVVGEQVEGMILSLQEGAALSRMESSMRQALYRQGLVATVRFSNFSYVQSPSMKRTIAMARIYATSSAPLLILGAECTETVQLAQAIHNESPRGAQPFVAFHCGCIEPEACSPALFGRSEGEHGSHGIIESANGGTLILEQVEHLDADAQRRLLRYLRTGASIPCGDYNPQRLDVRVIAVTDQDLGQAIEEGRFSAGLFYSLNVLSLTIPPLYNRKEDIQPLVEQFIEELGSNYKRYLNLTEGARQELLRYPWPGNLTQLHSFCERLMISAPHRSVSQEYVRRLLIEAYPVVLDLADAGRQELRSPEAMQLAQLMAKHNGNRERIARELGISKTTLWRRIKALGLPASVKELNPDEMLCLADAAVSLTD